MMMNIKISADLLQVKQKCVEGARRSGLPALGSGPVASGPEHPISPQTAPLSAETKRGKNAIVRFP